ncbi:hypothetical protein KO465_06770 [Candidatus Micrarchaeota archaeon]|nr:hypothetical protein [Candidatus Micrarchaeota archaeon]
MPCVEDLQFTDWSSWSDEGCINTTHMNQSRFLTEYDANECGTFENVTHYEYQSVEDGTCAEPCVENISNTTWSEWSDEGCINTTHMNQSRFLTEYDANYCGETENVTYTEYQSVEDGTCAEPIEINVTLISPADEEVIETNETNLTYSVNLEANCTVYHNITGWSPDCETNETTGASCEVGPLDNGVYEWNVYCVDSSNATNNGWAEETNRTFTIEYYPPLEIDLISPDEDEILTSNNLTLNYSVNLESNCTVYHDGSGEWSADCTNNETLDGSCELMDLDNGVYVWNVYCVQSNNSINNAWAESNRTFMINYVAPPEPVPVDVTLIYPEDEAIIETNTTSLFYSVNLESNCSVYTNETGAWEETCDAVEILSGSCVLNDLSNGVYEWNVYCVDSSNATNNAWAEETNRTFTINYTEPLEPVLIEISLVSPLDLAVIETNTTSLMYVVNLESNCEVYLNDTLWDIVCTHNNVYGGSCSTGVLSNGVYEWNVYCEESINSSNNAWADENWTFTIDYEEPCTQNITFTSWSSWSDEECINTTHMNQTRFIIQYDANDCGSFENVTYAQSRLIEDGSCSSEEPSPSPRRNDAGYECNRDSNCESDEYCNSRGDCVKLECGDCEYIEDHECVAYECCEDSDCDSDETCEDNECVEIEEDDTDDDTNDDTEDDTDDNTDNDFIHLKIYLNGNQKSLEEIFFNHDDYWDGTIQEHRIEIVERGCDDLGCYVIINIYSDPVQVKLYEGETKEVDLTGDGINDITITLKQLTDEKISFEVVSFDAPIKPTDPIIVPNTTTEEPENETITSEVLPKETDFVGLCFIIFVILAIIVAVGAILFYKQNKQPTIGDAPSSKLSKKKR